MSQVVSTSVLRKGEHMPLGAVGLLGLKDVSHGQVMLDLPAGLQLLTPVANGRGGYAAIPANEFFKPEGPVFLGDGEEPDWEVTLDLLCTERALVQCSKFVH